MSDRFPTARPLLPHEPPLTGIFDRERELDEVCAYLQEKGQAAVWAPRYSGRTTFLHCLEERLSTADFKVAIYVSPDRDIDSTHQAALFHSLATRIVDRSRLEKSQLKDLDSYAWDKPEIFLAFLRDLVTLSDHSITVLLDDCDKLPSAFLVVLLHELREAFRKRQEPAEGHLWRRISFVVTGAVSFRSLKLLEEAELSPFDDWKRCRLRDLSPAEAAQYLREAFSKLMIEVQESAIAAIVDHGGGDLWRLNAISQRLSVPGATVEPQDVERVVKELLKDYPADPSIAYMVGVIAHDPRCLDVVDRLLREPYRGETEFYPADLHRLQDQNVGISNQELSGGISLIRGSDDSPLSWQPRNGFCREVLKQHFTPQRLVRAFLDLGQYHRVEGHIERLAKQLADDFRNQILRFDEGAVRDIAEWHWAYRREDMATEEDEKRPFALSPEERKEPGRQVDRVTAGYKGLDFVLREVLGFGEFTLYDVDSSGGKLLANEFLLPAESSDEQTRSIIDFAESSEDLTREERVFRSGVYSVEISSEPRLEGESRLKIVVPLRSFEGKVTGVLSLRTHDYMEEWAILFVRIPIVERTVNFIWRRLSRRRAEFHKALQKIMEDRRASTEAGSNRVKPLWLAAKFDTETVRYFTEKNRDLPQGFALKLLKFDSGRIFTQIRSAIVKKDSFVLFDLSNLSNNVLFELGLAMGAHRPGLLLRQGKRDPIPELLTDLISGEYNLQNPLGESFSGPLLDSWEDYQRHRGKKGYSYLLRCPCDDQPAEPFVLVIDHDEYSDQVEFRSMIEKALPREKKMTVVHLWERGGLNPAILAAGDLDKLTAVFQKIDAATLVIARIERSEDVPDAAARFVATGLALGLAIRKKKKNVILTVRRREGQLDLPSDLNGSNYIDFDEHSRQNLPEAIREKFQQLDQHPVNIVSR